MFSELEETVRRDLNHAEEQAAQGPRAHDDHRDPPDAHRGAAQRRRRCRANPRYKLLNEQIFAARGEDLRDQHRRRRAARDPRRHDRPRGRVHERPAAPDGRPGARSARTGTRRRRSPGVQLAIGANSPFFFGRELWRETRIALFEQTTDTRPEELKAQGVRPRVWFGERWITSIFDLFEENVRYFPALLPVVEDEDPVAVLESGGAPQLQELRLHNGTIYRWNRPIYDVVARPPAPARREPRAAGRADDRRHARQRRLLLRARARAGRGRPPGLDRRCRSRRPSENFYAGARDGHRRARCTGRASARRRRPSSCCAGCCRWPATGLARWGVDAADADRLLEIIERRCVDAGQRRLLAGGGVPPALRPPRPRRRAARDDRPLPRAHALQRTGPHLAAARAAALARGTRLTRRGFRARDARARTTSRWTHRTRWS